MRQISFRSKQTKGFSLIEVVLAIGIFLITVLALVGLLGPTLQSVDEVEQIDEITSVVNTLNAFLQGSPDIGNSSTVPPGSKFDAVYDAVADSDDHATIFIFRRYTSATSTDVELIVGFRAEASIDASAELNAVDFNNLAGPVYRVVLTASSVTPDTYLNETKPNRNGDGIFTLSSDLADYDEGYLALEIRIFDIETDTSISAGGSGALPPLSNLSSLNNIEPIFTYNTAIVR